MAANVTAYDFRAINNGDKNVAAFANKRDALGFAKACGWQAANVGRAYNRFSLFWVVVQNIGDDLRVLTKDRAWFDMPHPGRS